jgi:small-conductance mechanosensitive channel
MRAMLLISVLPVIQTLRAHAEGLAAWRKRPNAILAGQAMNLASLVCTLFVALNLGVPGYLMGVIAILVAVTMTLVTIRMGLVWAEMEDAFDRPPRPLRASEG